MSEQKLKTAFDRMGPTSESRQRMLNNILAAHEAQEVGAAHEDGAVEVSRDTGAAVAPAALEPTEAHAKASASASQAAATAATATAKIASQPKRRSKKFSFINYAIPIAACLLFAAIAPIALPQFANMILDVGPVTTSPVPVSSSSLNTENSVEDMTADEYADPQSSVPNGSANVEGSDEADLTPDPAAELPASETTTETPDETPTPEVPAAEAPTETSTPETSAETLIPEASVDAIYDHAAPMALAESEPIKISSLSVVEIVAIILSALALMAALIVAIVCAVNWRRSKGQVPQ